MRHNRRESSNKGDAVNMQPQCLHDKIADTIVVKA
jgi:hypothetical protein